MQLSRLEVLGFKTFARKLDVRLTGGITAVVGPNGCGKTNVVDSIRWVLGEQRPSQIRLERMEDVIFKGNATRKPLGMAEVSLTIDNESRRLPVDMPEITITRRLFRSGESEYLLNKKTCRLADINDLFMDTGLGTDSYSVFEQGMINSILSDKTEDRRHIFEEAAGVTKYKARRRTAMNRMLSIEDDLNRVGDIVAELERRVESLHRQAQKAARYRALRSEIKARTVGIAACEIGKLRAKMDSASGELAATQEQSEGLRERITTVAGEYENLSVDIIGAERELEEAGTAFNTVRTEIAEREKDLARLDSRIEYLGQSAVKSRETARQNSDALERMAETHGRYGEEMEAVAARLEEVARAATEARERFREFEGQVTAKDGEHRSLESEYRRLEKEIASCRAMIVTVRVRRESGETRLSEILRRRGELETAVADAEGECARLREEKLRNTGREHELGRTLLEMRNTLGAKARDLETLDAGLRAVREELATLRAEQDFLAEVLRTYAGYSDGVRNAVSAEVLSGRVLGVLADCVSADERYARAVGAALSDSLQSILVDGPVAALDGARWMDAETRGRAVFLPLEGGETTVRVFPDVEGVIGPVWEYIRADKRFRPVLRKLIGDMCIVDTLETAWLLHEAEGGRYVTLDGALVGAYGEIHSGNNGEGENQTTLGRREKLEALNAGFTGKSEEVKSLEARRATLAGESEALRTAIRDAEKALEELRRETALITSDEAHIAARRDAAGETLAALKHEAERIRESFEDLEFEIQEMEGNIIGFEEQFHGVEKKLKDTAHEIMELRSELESRRADLNAREVERASLTEKKASLVREIESARERRETLAQSARTLQQEIENAEREMLEAGERKQELSRILETHGAEYERLRILKEEVERRYADMRARRSETERVLQNLRREQGDLARRESSLTLGRDEAALRTQAIVERLSDEFFIPPEEIPGPPEDPEYNPEQERLLLEDLRRKVQTLGDVNMAAEDDYREEKERLDFLARERDDLVEARRALEETIQKINHIARERFKETFESIRTNFTKTFADFFEGGYCDLALEEGEDPLEASILITARPPGKNVRSINLLSSGERALTAISLLFAIYLVKPSPFCILDEVDAPLDDANIDRYLRVIREFSKNTQFIMVSHNKKSMAAADNLYGITMDEPGLSTLVSVRLSEVDVSEKTGTLLRSI